ncbi:hypothetical protein HMI54_012796, partial [Coelomomyces lativittatus]
FSTQPLFRYTRQLTNANADGLPWTLNPTTTLGNLLFKYTNMVTPLPILTSLLKLLPWASTEMQQGIHTLLPTLNFTSPYVRKPKDSYFIDKLKYVQVASQTTSFHPNFHWGLNQEMNIYSNAPLTSPYILMNEFLKVFHPIYPTKECDYLNRKKKMKYWVIDKKLPFYIHPQNFYYIPIPLSHNATMYVALSNREIKPDVLFALYKLPSIYRFTGSKLAIPLLNIFNDTHFNLSSLLHVNPLMKDMTNNERNLTIFRHAAGIQLSSEFGIQLHSLTQFGDFEPTLYQPPKVPPPTTHECEFSRFQ